MQDMEIMRKTSNSVISSTTVSSTTVLSERGNAETTSDESVITTAPVSSTIGSTTLPTDINNSDNETEKIELDSLEENSIHAFSDEKDNEVETEAPEMYETSTVIATSISTSEAISYFNPENLPKLESV